MREEMRLIVGDCLEVMPTLDENSMDSIVTDPPYGLSFMGKDWDHGVPGEHFWREALRVAKPGAHLLAFGGTRTFHRLAVAIEDAGWEIRDTVMWVYGSGFPKSLDVSKAIDKMRGAEREVVGRNPNDREKRENGMSDYGLQGGVGNGTLTAPATPEAKQWEGWGTALKPAWEPIIVARKPLDGTVAQNVLKWGVGGLNIDGGRVGTETHTVHGKDPGHFQPGSGSTKKDYRQVSGRFPANLIHDGSQEVLELFPETKPSKTRPPTGKPLFATGGRAVEWNDNSVMDTTERGVNDNGGSAARFFYCAKASKADRGEDNKHPTVKPTNLMRYLVKLVTPPGGTVLDPFMGSGSTGKACKLEGMDFIGIEQNAEYVEIAERRLKGV